MNTDLTFFTNEPGQTLLDRFKRTLKHARFFDILVGYFRTTGFYLLYEALESIEKIRLLVGLKVDPTAYEAIQAVQNQQAFDFESHKRVKEKYRVSTIEELEDAEDSYDVEMGLRKFIEFLQSGKLEIRAYPSHNLHAKVYICRFGEDALDYGRVITGSSNFSEAGLVENREFNVELKNSADVKFALERFEELWKDGVDVTQEYVDTVRTHTWLNDQITPYELYLKFLYEYFQEDISLEDEGAEVYLPEGFLDLKYQRQAVVSARKILESYNGVFLSDVVGLGKTYIAALLARELGGKTLIICPPVLKSYWEDTFFEFGIRSFKVESHGKLDKIINDGHDKFTQVIVDEAHRFRNELTQGYEKLHQICWGKKVILVSATPLNNTINDIYSQLKLFQVPKKSTIPGVPNLQKFFQTLLKRLNQFGKDDPEYLPTVKAVSEEVRNKVLKYVMVRRTRTEVANFYREDLEKQGLWFPEIEDPGKIIYSFDDKTNVIFNRTIDLLKQFMYARYTPLLYLKKPLTEFEKQSQRNVGGFMKGILVKRLESSFFAFKNTLHRFIDSYEKFIQMYNQGTVYISKKVNVFDLLDADDEDLLLKLVEEEKVQKYDSKEFQSRFINDLNHDLELLKSIQNLWQNVTNDPKLDQFIKELKTNSVLKNNKLVIFTESSETGDYLYWNLKGKFNGKVMFYSSGGGIYDGAKHSISVSRDLIRENFDQNSKTQSDEIRILISTDVLSEGINLHRSNVVINYDLPWNPAKVMQRVGRVNRVGTKHNKIYIFNFFPTAESEMHLGLENSIKSKIQAFHDTLGEDAKYLTEEEEISTHKLFGEMLYRRLTDKKSYQGEEEAEQSELEYLHFIRKLRDEKPDVFDKIKRLPKKARTGRKVPGMENNQLLTFFRKGKLKKFYITDGNQPRELTFFEAADYLKCEPEVPRKKVPSDFYERLNQNKKAFEEATSAETLEVTTEKGGLTNERYIIRRLKAQDMKQFKGFTDDDEEFLKLVLKAFENGIIPKNTSKRIRRKLEREGNPLKVLFILRKDIPTNLLYKESPTQITSLEKREVILSEYFIGEVK